MQPAENGQPADKGKNNRPRTVYPVGEIPHLWANGIGREVRSTSASVQITPDCIRLISYATAVAVRTEAFTSQGVRVYLFTSRGYSRTTSKLISRALAAIPHKTHFVRDVLWDGRRETISETLAVSTSTPVDLGNITFCVPHLGSSIGSPGRSGHLENLAHLVETAKETAAKASRKAARFSPIMAGEFFSQAVLYWKTFLPDEPDPLTGIDFDGIAAAFAKANARQRAAEDAEKHRRRDYERREDLWMTEAAPALAALAEVVREFLTYRGPSSTPSAGLAFVLDYEAGKPIDPAQWEGAGFEYLGVALDDLLRNGSDLNPYSTNGGGARFVNSVRMVKPTFSFTKFVPPYPVPPVRKVFGKPVRDFVARLHRVREAVGLSYRSTTGDKFVRAFGRNLVRVSGDDLRTSGNASVPVAVVRALWARHGAEVVEAARSPVALHFPEARRAGLYSWTGFEVAPVVGLASGSGSSLLRIGCHLVGSEDLCRLAARLGWPSPNADA